MKSYILLLGLLLGGFTAYADSTAKKETEAILILSLIHISEPTRPY